MKKLNKDFCYLKDMYEDEYYPKFLVDKVKHAIQELVLFLEENNNASLNDVQKILDKVVIKINYLCDEFYENDSEIETVARESIGDTIFKILNYFDIDIDIEEAIRERDW